MVTKTAGKGDAGDMGRQTRFVHLVEVENERLLITYGSADERLEPEGGLLSAVVVLLRQLLEGTFHQFYVDC